LCPTQ